MRVVLDTNVIVSGLLWKGAVSKIIEAWTDGEFDVVVSSETFDELQRVLTELAKNKIASSDLLTMVANKALWVTSKSLDKQICTDADDDKFISTALAGRAIYVVTGDKALLAVQSFNGVEIITPKAFLIKLF